MPRATKTAPDKQREIVHTVDDFRTEIIKTGMILCKRAQERSAADEFQNLEAITNLFNAVK